MGSLPIRILLIEDDVEDAQLVEMMLARWKRMSVSDLQFDLSQVDYLQKALAYLIAERFDLILLDLSIPDSSGFETFARVHESASDVPIVVLSGSNDEDLATKAVNAGAQDYLVKGQITAELLVRTIRHSIERHRMRVELERFTRDLQASENRFRKIIHKNADGIIIVDKNKIVQFINSAGEKLLNQSSDKLLGRPFNFPIEVDKTIEININRGPQLAATAELRIVEISWHDEDVYLVSVRDITERKRAEAALQKAKDELELQVQVRTQELRQTNEELKLTLAESEQRRDRIDAILRSVVDGLIVTDVHNRIAMMNRQAESILGLDFNEVSGQSIETAINNPTLRDRIAATLNKRANNGFQFDLKLSAPQPNGTIRVTTALIKDKAAQPSGVIAIMYDVTKERELDRIKTEFISTAAHELRTPLTSIQGFSEILMYRSNLSSEAKEKYIGFIHGQAVALSQLVNNLLDISRLEAGESLELQKSRSPVQDAVSPAIAFFANAGQHQIKVNLEQDNLAWFVDREKIEVVLKNIISNAINYSPNGSEINIIGTVLQEEQSGQRFYLVSVKDQGIGMTPEQLSRIFENFYRVDASNTATGGIGLGMAIVKNIIELHGGRIWVESKPNEGTTVSFTLPLVEAET